MWYFISYTFSILNGVPVGKFTMNFGILIENHFVIHWFWGTIQASLRKVSWQFKPLWEKSLGIICFARIQTYFITLVNLGCFMGIGCSSTCTSMLWSSFDDGWSKTEVILGSNGSEAQQSQMRPLCASNPLVLTCDLQKQTRFLYCDSMITGCWFWSHRQNRLVQVIICFAGTPST